MRQEKVKGDGGGHGRDARVARHRLIVGARAGLPVIDGDGMGRAFPELQMDMFSIYGVAPTPGALADPRGLEVVFAGIPIPLRWSGTRER
jgi:uncharacterized protein